MLKIYRFIKCPLARKIVGNNFTFIQCLTSNKSFNRIFNFLLIYLFFASSLTAQPTIAWERCLGGSSGDNAFSMCEAGDGNYMIAGISTSNDGDVAGPYIGGFDIWLLKIDTSGTILWQKKYGGDNYDVAQTIIRTSDGGFIMAGSTRSNNVPGRKGTTDYDLYLVRIDSIGNLLWQMCYGGTNDDEASDIKETPSGDFYILGNTASSDSDVSVHFGSADYWLIKVDSAGMLLSEHSYGGSSYDFGTNIIIDSSGVIHLLGFSSSNDSDVQGNHGGQDYWLVNVDSSGSILSNFSYGGSGADYACSMIKDGSNFVLSGWSTSNDGYVSGHHGSATDDDIWVVKTDSIGNIIWNRSYGSTLTDFQGVLQKDLSGNYLLFGTTDWADGDVSFTNGASDYWICYLDSSGNIIWERSAGGSNFEFFYFGFLSSSNKIILCGNSDSPTSGDVTGFHGGIGSDLWLVSLNDFSTQISENSFSYFGTAFPNPFTDNLAIELKKSEGTVFIKIFDTLGNICYASKQFSQSFSIDLSFLQSGLFEVMIYNEKVNGTFKVIKQ